MMTNEKDPTSKGKPIGSGILNDPESAKKILSLTADTMFLIDREGLCVDMEIHTDRWFLQDPSYFLGKNVFKQIPFETAQALRSNFLKVLSTSKKSVDNYEVQVAGKTYYFKCILSLFDETHILCQYRDITQRILLKQRIEIINRRLQEVEKVAQIGHWSFNIRTMIIQYTGYSGGIAKDMNTKFITKNDFLELVHPDDRFHLVEFFERNIAGLTKDHVDYQMNIQDSFFYFRIRIINFFVTEDGDKILEGYVQNITDIMVKQHELEMITLAVQNSTDYIFAMQTDGKLVFGNHKFRGFHCLGSNQDITNTNFFDSIANISGKARWQDIIQQLISSRKTLNFVLPKPIPEKPEVLAFDCTSYLVQDGRGADQIWTFGKDITERVQYEKQVKELNQIMSTVLTNIPMNISVKDTDNDFRYIFSNRMGKKIHWGVQDDIIGKTDFDLFSKEEAMILRSDDIASLDSREETRRILLNKDSNDNTIFFDQLRLLVEDENRSLLISIERDITKDKFMEKDLIDARIKAEESDKLKSAFIANMSHEIRTPLNAIVGFSKIIAETSDPEERKSYYSIVETNNGRLLGLINEILDLSKIESGIMEFDMETMNLPALCRDIQQTLGFRCQPDVKLIFDDSDNNLLLSTDKNRLSQVFNNLIGNAIKFTKKGSIHFGYELKENFLEFYVTDTGTGIPEDKVDKVFDRFIKGDNFTQGTGLGLPICRSIIEKMGGTISLKSTFGKGTIFTFTLPAKSVISMTSPKSRADIGNAKVILVAEDTDSNYLLLESMIGNHYILQRAMNGMEVVTMFHESKPDLIMMDIKMPVMNGIEATKIIRSISPDIPIIAQSAYAFDQDRNAAMEAGCNDFLAKPYNKAQILDTLRKTLNGL
jgi:signal transduction histidine kinase